MELPELIPATISALKTGWKWLKENDLNDEAITAAKSLKNWVVGLFKNSPAATKAVEDLEVSSEHTEAEKSLSIFLQHLLDNQTALTKELIQLLTQMETAGKAAGVKDFTIFHKGSGDIVAGDKLVKGSRQINQTGDKAIYLEKNQGNININ